MGHYEVGLILDLTLEDKDAKGAAASLLCCQGVISSGHTLVPART
jgi:hypothetical protein